MEQDAETRAGSSQTKCDLTAGTCFCATKHNLEEKRRQSRGGAHHPKRFAFHNAGFRLPGGLMWFPREGWWVARPGGGGP